MSSYPATPQRGHLYWAQVPYLPERPLDVLRRMSGGTVRVALTFKTRPILVVQNRRDNANPAYPFVLVTAVHSIKPGELEKLRRIICSRQSRKVTALQRTFRNPENR